MLHSTELIATTTWKRLMCRCITQVYWYTIIPSYCQSPSQHPSQTTSIHILSYILIDVFDNIWHSRYGGTTRHAFVHKWFWARFMWHERNSNANIIVEYARHCPSDWIVMFSRMNLRLPERLSVWPRTCWLWRTKKFYYIAWNTLYNSSLSPGFFDQ